MGWVRHGSLVLRSSPLSINFWLYLFNFQENVLTETLSEEEFKALNTKLLSTWTEPLKTEVNIPVLNLPPISEQDIVNEDSGLAARIRLDSIDLRKRFEAEDKIKSNSDYETKIFGFAKYSEGKT
ncbi:hypothetical protein HZS_8 [Henneguya salminicola]|nr:hypothetical protein HZS_8 [Henneguya salminicola]